MELKCHFARRNIRWNSPFNRTAYGIEIQYC